ncbi:MAG: adenylate/guanylate cyclase domain-containing protein [Chitinophagaceae bacterium]|nr:MAG: adenylate/guanylate cyclase domain-containing protein [Chitinophagaceae bacterium]
MISRRILYYKLQVLINISIIWVIFAFLFLYNIILIEKDLVTGRSLLLFSLAFAIIGFIISASLLFYLKNAFRNYPLWISVALKMTITFTIFIIIAFILLAFYFVFSSHKNLNEYAKGFYENVFLTRAFLIFILDLGIMTLLTILILEVIDKYGPGGFWSMMRGEYNKPKIENRIFIFLDINNATTIAEKLGHTKYFRLLRDFFSDITIPILANGGEIYQYVGDEVVLSWKNTPLNKQRCFKFLRNAFYLVKRREARYMKRFGICPTFKAGIHAGEVTAGVIGIIKKDLVYSGDTLNTAARIRGKCHELDESFVLSGDFLQNFNTPYTYQVNEIGEMEFKGRKEKEKLYALSFE